MDEETPVKALPSGGENAEANSPKGLAFTIDFGSKKNIDAQRHKSLVEKYQKRHRRGQSLSKLDDLPQNSVKKHPLSGNLPRKSSFQSEGYFSSEEKCDKNKNGNAKTDLTLQLKNGTNRMAQSFTGTTLPSIESPEIELKDISSPEMDLISPISPNINKTQNINDLTFVKIKPIRQLSNPETSHNNDISVIDLENETFTADPVTDIDKDIDRSDTVSDAGTYTVEADNYTEAQKLRMSIDREFKIEEISGIEKTEEYVRSLVDFNSVSKKCDVKSVKIKNVSSENSANLKSVVTDLSPNLDETITEKTFSKVIYPSERSKGNGLDKLKDQGSIISVTSSGVFRQQKEIENKHVRHLSLTKSEVHVEDYIDKKHSEIPDENVKYNKSALPKLSANIINVQSISIKSKDMESNSEDEDYTKSECIKGSLNLGKLSNLPPPVGGYSGKNSPSKIPSPVHSLSRPRSGNSYQNVDFSDSSIETECYLKPTQNIINSLQKKLSLESDPDSDYESKYITLNNTAQNFLKQKTSHTRHNSLEGKTIQISNKLEHFQSKNLQSIDQTFSKLNQYNQPKNIQKIQNSPNNSPVRRSSSFSLKTQLNISKNTNLQKDMLLRESTRSNNPLQKSTSSSLIKTLQDHPRIDRNKFGDTESSSEDDIEKTMQRKKDMSNLTSTRYNRAFSLRRGRLDSESSSVKCPNTPEMRRKFQPERAISVDRKTVRSQLDVQSRYLSNITKKAASPKPEIARNVPKNLQLTPKTPVSKTQILSRTDSGRFSMRSSKSPASGLQKSGKKDLGSAKKPGGRSNSSLTSREVDFQNWKRRKSYDPMKAAAEGKRKEMEKRQNIMTQSYNECVVDCDSSPSHSSSVHRSQVTSLLNNQVNGKF